MRLQPNKVNWVGRPGTDVVTTLRLNTSLDLHISLNVVHTNISQKRKHVTVARKATVSPGTWYNSIKYFTLFYEVKYYFTCNITSVNIPVHVPVGGTQVKISHNIVETIIKTICMSVLSRVHLDGWPCHGVEEPVIGQIFQSTHRDDLTKTIDTLQRVQTYRDDEGRNLEVDL